MSRSCRTVPEWLEARWQGRLSGADERRLGQHLSGCTGCREQAADAAPLDLFARLTTGSLPSGVGDYILGGLRVEEQRPRRLAALWPGFWSAPWPAMASLAAAAGLILAWVVAGSDTPPRLPGGEPWLPAHAMNNAVATIEDIRSDTAEVFAFSVPEGVGGRTEVILIVDRSIDL